MFPDPDNIQSLSIIELKNRIQPYFENPHIIIGAGNRHLLDAGLQAILKLYLYHKRQWLEVIEHQSTIAHDRHADLLTQHRPIALYFI